MRVCGSRALVGVLILGAMLGARAAEPVNVLGEGVQLDCRHARPERLECGYRLLRPATVQSAEASVGETELPAPTLEPRAPGAVSAVLLLVDTSDPARASAVARAAVHAKALAAAGGDHHHFGLAAFDSDLRMLAPIGSPAEAIATASGRLSAQGRTTELYRNALEAIRLISAYPADRRALVMFSDGLAEDRAYFHADVVREAKAAGVVIFGVGYPRSVSQSVALQTLRRLADETGGAFVDVGSAGALPGDFVHGVFDLLDNGGSLVVDLQPAVDSANPGGDAAVRVRLHTAAGTWQAMVPVTLPEHAPEPVVKVVEVPKVVEVEKLVEVPVERPATAGSTTAPAATTPGGIDERLLWYAVLGVGAALVVAMLAMLVVVLRRRGAAEGAAAVAPAAPLHTYAFLEAQDGSGERHPVTSVTYRVGRHDDNDLVLADASVSRHHAEIRRGRDGRFTITDLESMNGVFVNGRRERDAQLQDGDVVEFGDLRMHFAVDTDDESEGEETVMLKTVMPLASLESVSRDAAADDGAGEADKKRA